MKSNNFNSTEFEGIKDFTSSHALRGNSYITVYSNSSMHSQLQVGNEIEIEKETGENIVSANNSKKLLGEVRG